MTRVRSSTTKVYCCGDFLCAVSDDELTISDGQDALVVSSLISKGNAVFNVDVLKLTCGRTQVCLSILNRNKVLSNLDVIYTTGDGKVLNVKFTTQLRCGVFNTAPILVAMSPVLVPTVAARASRSVCAALVSILASRVVMSALSALSSRAVCVAAEIGLAASEVLSTSPRPRSALTRTTSPVLELTLVTAPPPPPPEPAMYEAHPDEDPSPALSLLVSVSSPSSPRANRVSGKLPSRAS